MNTSNKLQALFNLQPGEGRLVSLLLLLYFCIGMAFTFIQTTAFTLFLAEFDSQALSLAYIAMAVILIYSAAQASSAIERMRYLRSVDLDWALSCRQAMLERIARYGHKTERIDPIEGFNEVRQIGLQAGETLIESGAPSFCRPVVSAA